MDLYYVMDATMLAKLMTLLAMCQGLDQRLALSAMTTHAAQALVPLASTLDAWATEAQGESYTPCPECGALVRSPYLWACSPCHIWHCARCRESHEELP
jgi:hypothetical protein